MYRLERRLCGRIKLNLTEGLLVSMLGSKLFRRPSYSPELAPELLELSKKIFRWNLEKFRAEGPYIKSNIFLVSGRIAFDHYNFLQNYACTLQNWRQNYWNSQKKIFVGTWKNFERTVPI